MSGTLFASLRGNVWMIRNYGWRRWWRAQVLEWGAGEATYKPGDWRRKPKPDGGQIHGCSRPLIGGRNDARQEPERSRIAPPVLASVEPRREAVMVGLDTEQADWRDRDPDRKRAPRRSSEALARETLDAIRLAIEAAADDRAAVVVIRTLLADGPPPQPKDTLPVGRLLRAVKRTRRARWTLT